MAAKDGLHEIRSSADGVVYVSRLAPWFLEDDSGLSCYLDEPNGLLYITTGQELFTTSVHTALEQRATRISPLVTLWALTQRRRRVDIAPAAVVGVKEENMRTVLSCLMRLRVVGVLGLALRFAFG